MIEYLWTGKKIEPDDRIECCFKCDEPTGRAGVYDDSLYDEDGEGPYCEKCWKEETGDE